MLDFLWPILEAGVLQSACVRVCVSGGGGRPYLFLTLHDGWSIGKGKGKGACGSSFYLNRYCFKMASCSIPLWPFCFFSTRGKSLKLTLLPCGHFWEFFRGYRMGPGAVTLMSQAVSLLWLATCSLHCQFSRGTLQMDSHGWNPIASSG